RYRGLEEVVALIDVLVLASSYPRAAACAVQVVADGVAALVESAGARPVAPPGNGLVGGNLGASLSELRVRDADARWSRLIELATRLRGWSFELSDWIGLHYFAHAEAPLRSMIT